KEISDDNVLIDDLGSAEVDRILGDKAANKLREEAELIEAVSEPFDENLYRSGYLAPVFFGSAINNFGVQELLETFIEIAPRPQGREADARVIDPAENKFTGFIFKIHANLDPNHRDRIAFCRITSG